MEQNTIQILMFTESDKDKKMYIATTQGLKYDHMVISETQEKAWLELKKFWEQTLQDEEGLTFDEASEYYGFFVRSTKIVLNKPFDLSN